MYPLRYFADSYFPGRYFPPLEDAQDGAAAVRSRTRGITRPGKELAVGDDIPTPLLQDDDIAAVLLALLVA